MENKYHKFAQIIGDPIIGEGTWIGPFTIIDGSGGLKIGKNCDISSGVHIYTHDTVKRCLSNKKFNSDGSVNRDLIEKDSVNIGDNTFIGGNAVILKGVKIGKCCIIGAGAIVTKNVSDYTAVAGIPAKKIGDIKIQDNQVKIELLK